MWRSTSVPETIFRRSIRLKQTHIERVGRSKLIQMTELNWAGRRIFHELYSLSLVCLMKSSTFRLGLRFSSLISLNLLSNITTMPGRGWGVLPYVSYIWYVPPHRVEFLHRFGLKTGIHFAHFGLESDMVFEGATECMNVFIVSIRNE